MSGWDAYVALMTNVTNGSIYGVDGGHWAGNFPGQTANVLKGLASIQNNAPESITMGDVKYMCLRVNDDIATYRKGGAGVVMGKTGKAMVLAYHTDAISAQDCVVSVSKCMDALKAVGF